MEQARPSANRSWRAGITLLVLVGAIQLTSDALAQGAWPGATWRSGVNGDPIIHQDAVEAFGNWRGRPIAVAVVYTDRRDWHSMTRGSDWLFDNFRDFRGQLVISQGLLPDGRSQDLPGCAAGIYDGYWRDFGALMVRRGRADSIVRLGWEFNGDYVSWAATNTAQWIACYRRAALAIRFANPAVVLDWTINSHGTPGQLCGGVSTNCYPGDDVVDIIGIDNYDMGPSARTEEDFNRTASRPDGLTWLFEFAMARGKEFSVGEWGIAPGSHWNDVGENPLFIRLMYNWFRDHAASLAYEAYFNHCDAAVGSNLFRPATDAGCRQNRSAAWQYRTLFRDRASVPTVP